MVSFSFYTCFGSIRQEKKDPKLFGKIILIPMGEIMPSRSFYFTPSLGWSKPFRLINLKLNFKLPWDDDDPGSEIVTIRSWQKDRVKEIHESLLASLKVINLHGVQDSSLGTGLHRIEVPFFRIRVLFKNQILYWNEQRQSEH